MTPIRKVLIANRGEIAVRIIRACRELGVVAVAVYSDADRDALHVRLADEAHRIGPSPAAESYLRADALVEAALDCGADAVHPGYGFLSERAHFARACAAAGLTFIGPSADAIELLGSKIAAKRLALANDVPIAPGYDGADQSPEHLAREARGIGYPLLIKASAGGGGRGMRVVAHAGDFAAALAGARREALASFGDDSVLLEKLIERPRHVEFQVLADHHGNVVHLHERECSIQRRHQKILEESPCVALSDALRAEMGAAAVRLARAASYHNAGTVEFMLDADGAYYFLEMNTRLQVEHPVTELVTGYDLVRLQIAVAAGEPLPFTQDQIHARGHAIEARVYAEDPVSFLPATGPVYALALPDGPGIRNDVGLAAGDEVTVHYDPMVAKLTVYGQDRPHAVSRMQRALDDYAVLGLTTNLALLRAVVAHEAFVAGATHTGFLAEANLAQALAEPQIPPEILIAAAFARMQACPPRANPFEQPWRAAGDQHHFAFRSAGRLRRLALSTHAAGWVAEVQGATLPVELVAWRDSQLTLRFGAVHERFSVADTGATLYLHWRGRHWTLERFRGLSVDDVGATREGAAGHAGLLAPMSGTVVKVLVVEGQQVAAREPLLVLEAMKMEHTVVAPSAGLVTRLPYQPGQLVSGGATVVELESLPPTPEP